MPQYLMSDSGKRDFHRPQALLHLKLLHVICQIANMILKMQRTIC